MEPSGTAERHLATKAGDYMGRVWESRDLLTPELYLQCALDSSEAYCGTTFADDDAVFNSFISNPRMQLIDKLFPCAEGGASRFVHVVDSYATGPNAAELRGTDVVYFYDGGDHRALQGVVKFGRQASSIVLPDHDFVAAAHGGAVEAVLDDLTGTVVRHCQSVFMATAHFTAKLKKPCPLLRTLKLSARVHSVEQGGLSCITQGEIRDDKGVLIATAEAKMVDTFKLRALYN